MVEAVVGGVVPVGDGEWRWWVMRRYQSVVDVRGCVNEKKKEERMLSDGTTVLSGTKAVFGS